MKTRRLLRYFVYGMLERWEPAILRQDIAEFDSMAVNNDYLVNCAMSVIEDSAAKLRQS